MLKDIALASDLSTAYRESLKSATGEAGGDDEVGLAVNVLTSSAWPSYKVTSAVLPEKVRMLIHRRKGVMFANDLPCCCHPR